MQVAAINQNKQSKGQWEKAKNLGFVKEYPIYKVIRQPLKQQENDHTSDESAQ